MTSHAAWLPARRWARGALLTCCAVLFTAACSQHPGRSDGLRPWPVGDPGPSDAALTTAVQAALFEEHCLLTSDVEVRSADGTVDLRGRVDDATAASCAVAVASRVEGVRHVEHLLRVGPSAPEAIPASVRITANVQAALARDSSVRGTALDAVVVDGTVVLLGAVPTREVEQRAVALARRASEGRAVESRLRVDVPRVGPTRPMPALEWTDVELATRIRARYFVDDEMRHRRLDVTVDRGEVHQVGVVGGAEERERALAIASRVQGTSAVHDALAIDVALGSGGLREAGGRTRVSGPACSSPAAHAPAVHHVRSPRQGLVMDS